MRDIAFPLKAFGVKRKEPYLEEAEGPEIHVLNVPHATCGNKIVSAEGEGGGMVGENAPWIFISSIFLKKGQGSEAALNCIITSRAALRLKAALDHVMTSRAPFRLKSARATAALPPVWAPYFK